MKKFHGNINYKKYWFRISKFIKDRLRRVLVFCCLTPAGMYDYIKLEEVAPGFSTVRGPDCRSCDLMCHTQFPCV